MNFSLFAKIFTNLFLNLSYGSGSVVLTGLEPSEILEAIHNATMHKLFPDGKPQREKITNKGLKPVE